MSARERVDLEGLRRAHVVNLMTPPGGTAHLVEPHELEALLAVVDAARMYVEQGPGEYKLLLAALEPFTPADGCPSGTGGESVTAAASDALLSGAGGRSVPRLGGRSGPQIPTSGPAPSSFGRVLVARAELDQARRERGELARALRQVWNLAQGSTTIRAVVDQALSR